MTAATPARIAVLKYLQNHAAATRRRLNQAAERRRLTGEEPTEAWYTDLRSRSRTRIEVDNIAQAAGVPRAWLDHARADGDRGIRWSSAKQLPQPEPVAWYQLLDDLGTDINRLRDWTALAARYGHVGAAAEVGTATGFDRNLRALWARTATVTTLMGLDPDHAELMWGDRQQWIESATHLLDDLDVDTIQTLWRSAARSDTRAYALQARALADANLTIDTESAPPHPDTLIPLVRAAQKQHRPSPAPAAAAHSTLPHTPSTEAVPRNHAAAPVADTPIFSAASPSIASAVNAALGEASFDTESPPAFSDITEHTWPTAFAAPASTHEMEP
ncbi:hypothetical protein [Nocardia cyriacigeorgica]|uniref:hypothetical protein n=1 Tax=Nocardia cyriacigeorgica TaxID=135487 RepID=UPI0018963866|nr:hypothetical protein [Nocardia cyriacigeorgica]MBF6325868.1 hypothetical protein [Nocardia cyriacigeorgica]